LRRHECGRFNLTMTTPADIDGLLLEALKALMVQLLGKAADQERDFTLLVYDSPTFITTDTTVSVSQLTFANPLNPIASVDFIPSSSTFPDTSEVDVNQIGAADQFRYYPEGTFTKFGVTPGDSNNPTVATDQHLRQSRNGRSMPM
jgi:hypothetical protein